MFKRRREKKTDYKRRLALLKSGKPRIVVRRSLNYIHVQIVSFGAEGDAAVVEDFSKSIKEYGWPFHCGSTPAAYLTGLLAGLKARKAGIQEAILDMGLQTSVKGSVIYAAALGAIDAGLRIPIGESIIPSMERISGKHISDYAARLKKESNEKYRKQFSAYIKNNLDPEKITDYFEETKSRIISEFGIEKIEGVEKMEGV